MPGLDFGARVDGVSARVPHIHLHNDTVPNVDGVEQFIAERTAEVALHVGDLGRYPEEFRPIILTVGRRLVELAAAVDTVDAAIPEHADGDLNRLGQTLYERYRMELADFDQRLNGASAVVGPESGGSNDGGGSSGSPIAAQGPAFEFPLSSKWRTRPL
jgi:hypothetical protein